MPASPALGRKILVVDDEPLIARLIADALTAEGHSVDTAANGREALEKILAGPFDLILSDLRMPELDGVGLFRELERRHPELAARLVFVSGTTELPEYTNFLQECSVPVLSKPFHLDMLLRFVAQCLEVLG